MGLTVLREIKYHSHELQYELYKVETGSFKQQQFLFYVQLL